jgi:hypothetical protein
MRAMARAIMLTVCAVGLLVFPAAALATHDTRPSFELEALGHSPNPSTAESPQTNSDLAFWGDLAINGSYAGFRIVNIANPLGPQEVVDVQNCAGSQGDIVVWENILVRSWNSPAPAGATCMGQEVPQGWEGVHVFDISDPRSPQLITRVELPCGSHTQTAIPDRANERLVIYNHTSGGPCYFFDILEVPFANLGGAKLLRQEPVEGEHACHDSGVILGDVNMMACASGHMTNVFDIGENDNPGGSYTNPEFLYTIEEEGVGPIPGPDPHSGSWHSATFTWDGEILILGWEPGGGNLAECEATDDPVTHTMFFYDTSDGSKVGQWTLPRKQSQFENCTIHNYNILPIDDKYIVAGGHYQAGTWLVEFTDPANPVVRAYSDPPPISETLPLVGGGAWSTYWYNDHLYESSMREGLNVFRYTEEDILEATRELPHLNPQTQEFSRPGPGSAPGGSDNQGNTDNTSTDATNVGSNLGAGSGSGASSGTLKAVSSRGRLTIKSRVARVSRNGVARVRVACARGQDCRGTVRLTHRGRTVAQLSVNLKAGTARTYGLRLNKRGMRLVRKSGALSVRAVATGSKASKMDLRASRSD